MYFSNLLSKVLLFIGISLLTTLGFAQPLSPSQIDSVVQKAMDTFNVPGMAVAVIKDDAILLQKGYGIRSIKTKEPVNTKTLFGVASNTKAFTSAALAQLVDERKITWDTKVTDIIPEFKLYDPYVTREFTIRDLLTHRSGLGLGAGDLMVIPEGNSTSLEEMIHNLQYLKPVSSFRSKYDYDNLLYIIAGEIVTRVSGVEYEDYITTHFFEPLHMTRATMDLKKIRADDNRIDGHAPVDGELKITKETFTKIAKPAAGINASIEDMVKWVKVRLNYGRYGAHQKDSLFSKKQAQEMWTAQTITPHQKGKYNTHFSAYGLGWALKDVKGYLQASHTGGLFGIVSRITLLPELKLGIIVLTNQESGAAFNAVTNTIKDGYLGVQNQDRILQYNQSRLKAEKKADQITSKVKQEIQEQLNVKKTPLVTLEDITGTYKDSWFGEVTIQKANGKIRFTSKKSLHLKGNMIYYKGSTYVVNWDDPSFNADAFVTFSLSTEGIANGFTIQAISPLTDFSFDFQDLDFKKIN